MFKRIAAPVLLIFFSIALNAADIDNGRIKISFEEKYRAVTFFLFKRTWREKTIFRLFLRKILEPLSLICWLIIRFLM